MKHRRKPRFSVTRSRDSSRRMGFAVALILIPTVVTSFVVWRYWGAADDYSQTVADASDAWSEVLLRDFLDGFHLRASASVNYAYHETREALRSSNPLAAIRVLDSVPRTVASCRCQSPFSPAFTFFALPDGSNQTFVGSRPTGPAWDSLLQRIPTYDYMERPGDLTRGIDYLTQGDRLIIVSFSAVLDADAVVGYYGLAVDFETLASELIAPTVEYTIRHRLQGGLSPDLVTVIASYRGATLWQFGRDVASEESGMWFPMWPQPKPGVRLRAIVHPPLIAALFPNGLPGFPTHEILAAGGVLILASILSALLIWRINQVALQKEAFSAGISHEMRTPLTQILLAAETLQLRAGDRDALVARAATQIAREARRLATLVENALLFVRGQSSAVQLDLRLQPVGPLVRDAIDSLRDAANREGVEVRANVPANALAVLDAESMRRVIVNLLENAIKYASPGTVDVDVAIVQSEIVIAISDSGPGIPDEIRGTFWKPFVRADTPGRSQGGTGMGLPIVKQLVELHDGTITLQSTRSGTRFDIRIPVQGLNDSTEAVS